MIALFVVGLGRPAVDQIYTLTIPFHIPKPAGDAVDALSFVCHKQKAESMGRRVALKLKEVIDRQNFEINIQVGFFDSCMCTYRGLARQIKVTQHE